MEQIKELMQIDFTSLLFSVLIVLIGIKSITTVFEWAIDKLGLETKWVRERRERHDLLLKTSQNLNRLPHDDKLHIRQTHTLQLSNLIHNHFTYEMLYSFYLLSCFHISAKNSANYRK